MSKKVDKGMQMPELPVIDSGVEQEANLGTRLTNFDLSGNLSPLADTISINPAVLKSFYAGLQPYLRNLKNKTMSTLAANNQLSSSVTADRMGQVDTDIANLMLGKNTDLIQNAFQNRINLFGTGLNAVGNAANTKTQFNLANYSNQVAKAANDYYNSKLPSKKDLIASKVWSQLDPAGSYMGTWDNPNNNGPSARSMSGMPQAMQMYSAFKGGGMGGGMGGGGKVASSTSSVDTSYLNNQSPFGSGLNQNYGLLNQSGQSNNYANNYLNKYYGLN